MKPKVTVTDLFVHNVSKHVMKQKCFMIKRYPLSTGLEMGFLDKLRGKDKGALTIIPELEALKSKIARIPDDYPVYALVMGPGAGTARQQIPTICQVIDDAIKALQTGLDIHNRSITKPQIAAGLKRLVDQTSGPAFIGLVSTVINFDGIEELKRCMNELNRIAEKIR